VAPRLAVWYSQVPCSTRKYPAVVSDLGAADGLEMLRRAAHNPLQRKPRGQCCTVASRCTVPHYAALCCTGFNLVAQRCAVPHRVAPYRTVPHRVAPCCTVLHRAAPCCTAMHSPCCTMLHRVAPCCTAMHSPCCTVLHRVAPCCTALHRVAQRCTKLRGAVRSRLQQKPRQLVKHYCVARARPLAGTPCD
jgi:hypothetical protein